MNQGRPRASDLTAEELELLALEHVESMFAEVRAARDVVRERYHPVTLVKRHPFVAVAVAGMAEFMLVQYLRPRRAMSSDGKAPTSGIRASFLSGMAGSAGSVLPKLVTHWLSQKSKPD
jgi:hypothetical protein